MAEASLLQHLLTQCKGSDGSRTAASFECAASQLRVLGAPALRQAPAAELAEELLERAEQLVGSKQAASRLLGLQLMRSALANCHRRTFLQQHVQWAALLLSTLRAEQQRGQQAQQAAPQQPSAAAAEACACLAAYFGRVGRMLEVPGLRRDGAAAASKLAGILLHQPGQQAEQPAAPPLLVLPQGQAALLAALTALPASFRQQHKQLEAALLPLLMAAGAGSGGGGGRGLLAACVAALPRIPGDGSSWSAFCQRLLATAHSLLSMVSLQLDSAELAGAAAAAADPSAEPLPLPAAPARGGGALSGEAYTVAFGQLGAVLGVLQHLLAGSFPSAVPLPAAGLLLLVSRVTSIDDGASGSGKAASAAAASARFPQLCLHLPGLQAGALLLLQRLLAAAGAVGTPYFVAAARLLSDLLQRSSAAAGGAIAASALARCQLYAAVRQLLATAGVGAARHLAPALLQAAGAELYGRRAPQGGAEDGAEGPARKRARRGKQAAAMDMDAEAAAAAPLDDLGAAAQSQDQAVQAAALLALHALCACAAPLLTPQQRRQLDDLAAHVAATAAAAAAQLAGDAEAGGGAGLAALHLASFQLLLATLLAPAPHRPPHLAPALRLFRDAAGGGAPGGAGALAAFCREALLSCEALLHPRSLPPPASVRRVLPAGVEEDGAAGEPLGMPRFWSSVDAALLLQQEQAELQRQLAAAPQQQQENGVDQQPAEAEAAAPRQQPAAVAGGDQEMADAGEARPEQQQQQQQQTAPAAPAPAPQQKQAPQLPTAPAAGLSGMAAMLASPPAVPAAAAMPPAAAPPAAPAPAAAFQPAFAAAPPAHAPAAAPTAAPAPAAAAAAAVAAAAEESDSEGSLPDIDSGAESSDSGSDEA